MTRTFVALSLALTVGAQAEPRPDLGRAIELPAAAERLRERGVPAAEVATAVNAAKDHGLTAGEATDVLEAGAKGEKLDNFGRFVNDKLDEGLRGRELAEAIHEEQERRGKGGGGKGLDGEGPPGRDEAGTDEGKGKGKGKGKGPDGDPGEGKGAGKGKGPGGGH